MSLNPGTRLGPYEIVSRLGAGGMGEVFRARDTRLGREVALKVLPAEVSDDPARKARFEQEARAAAALNHPNITGLHDVGSDSGVSYIVTELIVGETLEAIIERGPIPVRKLIEIAVEISNGMAAAHAARIAHRDLKPANIMVTEDGRVKILDFGLAKQEVLAGATPDETVTAHHTTPGMILGTIAYMSPEQARGKPADYRSDQFSFGIIVYEMATGKKPFQKPESVQILSAILSEEPPPIDRHIPPTLKWAIDRCLAKDPADRYESTRDLHRELRHLRDHLSETSVTQTSAVEAAPAPRRRIRWAVPAAFAAGLVIAGGAAIVFAPPALPDQALYRFTPFSFEPGGQHSPVWSPDGKAVAYAARTATNLPYQIFVRYLDSPTPVQVSHLSESAQPLAWAPDGKRILFRTARTPSGIWSISSVGGEPEPFQSDEGYYGPITVSQDLKTVAGMGRGAESTIGVWYSSPPGEAPKQYTPEPFATKIVYNQPILKFSPDGRSILLFFHSDRHREEAWLLPYPPNPAKPPRQVMLGLPSYGGTPFFDWMPDSRHIMVLLHALPDSPPQIWLTDIDSGKRTAITSNTGGQVSIAVSPDGNRMVVSEMRGNYDVVQMNLDHGTVEPLISTDLDESMPAWAAKQPVLVYVTDRNGPQEIWLHMSGRLDRPVVTARDFPPDTTQWFMGPALSPDADRIVYARMERNGGGRAWISSVNGGAPVPLTNDARATEFTGSWSPDGAWFAYVAIYDGRKDLMKVKVSGQATPMQLKAKVQGETPVWSPDGEWIQAGDELISADGKTVRALGDHKSDAYVFAPNGKALYGIHSEAAQTVLFSLDIATGAEKIIGAVGRQYRPASNLHPALRFSLAPDGKSIAFGVGQSKFDLSMFAGFAPKRGLLASFFR